MNLDSTTTWTFLSNTMALNYNNNNKRINESKIGRDGESNGEGKKIVWYKYRRNEQKSKEKELCRDRSLFLFNTTIPRFWSFICLQISLRLRSNLQTDLIAVFSDSSDVVRYPIVPLLPT